MEWFRLVHNVYCNKIRTSHTVLARLKLVRGLKKFFFIVSEDEGKKRGDIIRPVPIQKSECLRLVWCENEKRKWKVMVSILMIDSPAFETPRMAVKAARMKIFIVREDELGCVELVREKKIGIYSWTRERGIWSDFYKWKMFTMMMWRKNQDDIINLHITASGYSLLSFLVKHHTRKPVRIFSRNTNIMHVHSFIGRDLSIFAILMKAVEGVQVVTPKPIFKPMVMPIRFKSLVSIMRAS